jgi:tetratricopeptide (TPR) repeat protein
MKIDRLRAMHDMPGWMVVAALLVAVLAGCAGSPPAGERPEPDVEALEPTSEEVMYRVFAGEYLGAEGDLQAAAVEYLEAAIESDDPEVARRATRIAFAAASWQEASMAADRWAVLEPESIPAQEAAAAAKLAVGDYLGAEFHLARILDILEDSTDAWVMVSRILSRARDPAQADEVLEQLRVDRKNADNADVFYARSQLAAQSRDLEQAFELARQAVELEPERVDLLTWAGRIALNLKLADTGLEYIRRAWLLDPGNQDLALAYSDLLARNGDGDAARQVMQAIKQTPEVMLARILFELASDRREAAEALFTRFGEMKFDDPQEKAFNQARAAEALGLRYQAIAFYGEVTEGEAAIASALRRAELMAMDGDLEAARAVLVKMRDTGSDRAMEQSWLTEARLLRESDDREAAFSLLDEALAVLPDSIPLLYSHSLLAAELHRVDVAERDLRTILAAQPENAAALNALGYTLADQTERFEEAEALIRQAYILQPDEASIVDSMGWIAYRLGRIEEALEFLRRAWELDRNPEIAAHLGEVLWVAGEHDQAIEVWREGAEADPENPALIETLSRLGVSL